MPMHWRLVDGIWEMLDESGRVLDSLVWDRDAGAYMDSTGRIVSRRWDLSRQECEKRAPKLCR